MIDLDLIIVGSLLIGLGVILILKEPSLKEIEDRVMNMTSTCDLLYGQGMYYIIKESDALHCQPSRINTTKINWNMQGAQNAN